MCVCVCVHFLCVDGMYNHTQKEVKNAPACAFGPRRRRHRCPSAPTLMSRPCYKSAVHMRTHAAYARVHANVITTYLWPPECDRPTLCCSHARSRALVRFLNLYTLARVQTCSRTRVRRYKVDHLLVRLMSVKPVRARKCCSPAPHRPFCSGSCRGVALRVAPIRSRRAGRASTGCIVIMHMCIVYRVRNGQEDDAKTFTRISNTKKGDYGKINSPVAVQGGRIGGWLRLACNAASEVRSYVRRARVQYWQRSIGVKTKTNILCRPFFPKKCQCVHALVRWSKVYSGLTIKSMSDDARA